MCQTAGWPDGQAGGARTTVRSNRTTVVLVPWFAGTQRAPATCRRRYRSRGFRVPCASASAPQWNEWGSADYTKGRGWGCG